MTKPNIVRVPPASVLLRMIGENGDFMILHSSKRTYIDRGLYQDKATGKYYCRWKNYYIEVKLKPLSKEHEWYRIYRYYAIGVIDGETYPVDYLCPHHGCMHTYGT